MTRKVFRTTIAGLGALALLSAASAAAAQGDGSPFRRSSSQLRAAVAKTGGGLAVSPLPTGQAVVVMVRRDRNGEIELHMTQDDVFVAHDGYATVMIGEQVTGNRQVSPGEWRGGAMIGARSYPMAPGDVLWIPAGLPHQVVVPAHGAFNYLAFKYPSAKRR
jgi:mannose-6-phosphate isomerase-like protein (cupin superfamily)